MNANAPWPQDDRDHNTHMRKAVILVAILGICGCSTSNAEQASKQDRSVVANATRELGRSLVAAGATLDGAPVTTLRQTGRCEAIMTTAKGGTAVRWKDLGALVARIKDGRTIYDVPGGGHHHVLSVRNGKSATDVAAGLSLLDEECAAA